MQDDGSWQRQVEAKATPGKTLNWFHPQAQDLADARASLASLATQHSVDDWVVPPLQLAWPGQEHGSETDRPSSSGPALRQLGEDAARLVGIARQDLQLDGQGTGVRDEVAAHREANAGRPQQGFGDRHPARVQVREHGHQLVGYRYFSRM